MKTLTPEQVFQHMADNVRDGKSPVDRLRVGEGSAWVPMSEQSCISGITSGNFEFILAPRTHTLNGYDVPAPETEAPAIKAKYWMFDSFESDGLCSDEWDGVEYDQNALSNGLWLSKEDAIANRKAFRGENPYDDSE